MSEAFRVLVEEAERLARAGAWEEAAARWVVAGGLAEERGAVPVAVQLYQSAGEAFRRADRPRDALRALGAARRRGGDGPQLRASLSAVLAARGRMGEALAEARAAGADPLGADAVVAVLLAIGSTASLERAVEELEPGTVVRRLRDAQLLRIRGALPEAARRLHALQATLETPVARAAVQLEAAEVAALRGDLDRARGLHEEAIEAFRRAHRSSLVWTAIASMVRTVLDGGAVPLVEPLRDGVRWAEERGFVLLGLDLGLCVARADRDPLAVARLERDAAALGCWRRAGRATMARAALASGAERVELLQRAVETLRDDVPLALRARVALEEARGSTRVPADLVRAVERAGMEPERTRLAALEG